MQDNQFEYIRELLKQRSGLVLTKDKVYLIESRLAPVARNHNMKSVDELITNLRVSKDPHLAAEITDAMACTESSFFRDRNCFSLLKDTLLPELCESRPKEEKLRIWCAASSTGQEPYSIAMMLDDDEGPLAQREIEILSTDLSERAIARAEAGRYTHFEVQRGLPIQLLIKFFDRCENEWTLKQAIRSRVSHRQHNLLDDFTELGVFDVILCRNVLLSFDPQTQKSVLPRLVGQLSPNGCLILGCEENITFAPDDYNLSAVENGFFRRTPTVSRQSSAPIKMNIAAS